jgi:TonB-linked SusC/RagA family outer membrane protein
MLKVSPIIQSSRYFILILLLLLFIGPFIPQAKAESQILEKKISIRIVQKNLKSAFDLISAQAAVPIIYGSAPELFGTLVRMEYRNQSLKRILDELLRPFPLTYHVIDNKIVISRTARKNGSGIGPDKISGQVTDTQGEPLPGATIRIKGQKNAVITDAKGEFALQEVSPSTLIQVSFIGYQTREINIADASSPIQIQLEKDSAHLTEVTVSTGYQDIAPERATGSFVKIDNELINRRVSTDIISRLEGVTSGLTLDRRQGGTPKLDVRSRSTILANDQPLIVLDNFPYDGNINNINPNDIDNITVLKDAAAASIWGVRAGNGVIVITTKKGKYNQPMKAELNVNLNLGEKPRLQSLSWISSADYIELEKYLFGKGFYDADIANTNSPPPLAPVVSLLLAARNGILSETSANTQIEAFKSYNVRSDMEKYLYRPSANQQYMLNVSGGSARQQYYFSAGYDHNLDNIVNNGNDRLTLRAANTFRPVPKLEISADLIFTQTQTSNNGLDYTAITNGASKMLYPYARLADDQENPLAIVRDYSSSFIETAQSKGLLDWQYVPLNEINNSNNRMVLFDTRLNTSAKYNLFPSLNAEVRYTYERANTNNRSLYGQETYFTRNLINRYTSVGTTGALTRPIPLGAILDQSYNALNSNAVRAQLNFDRSWQVHQVTAIAGMEIRQVETIGNGNRTYGYNDDLLTYNSQLNYSTTYTGYDKVRSVIPYSNSNFSGLFNGNVSYYSNAAYTYQNRYTMSGSARFDQSNLFGVNTNQKSLPLWSAGISWAIDREPFYKIAWLPNLKLRATFGYSGNLDNTLSAYTTATYSGLSYGSGLNQANISNPPNPELRWEKSGILNIGFDFNMRKDILSGSIEYYHKKGTDLLGLAPVDATAGITSYKVNVANNTGHGLDVTLNVRPVDRVFKWYASFLFSYATDQVTRYLVPGTNILGYVGALNTRNALPLEGKPVFAVYSYKWAGLDPATGSPRGYLPDGTISTDYAALQNVKPADLLYNGPARPPFFGSFRHSFSYKNVTLSANLAYAFGYYFHRPSINYSTLFTTWSGNSDYALRWQKPGDEQNTNVPSLVYPANPARDQFYNGSAATVEKGDHIRLQDISISYDLNHAFWRKTPFTSLRLYVYANNLAILWRANHAGIDPEYPVLPPQRTIAMGIKAGF